MPREPLDSRLRGPLKHTHLRPLACALLALVACAGPRDDWHAQLDDWEASLEEVTEAPELRPIDEQSGLEDLILNALAHNPGLRAAFDRWDAALQRVPQAAALPAPRLTFAAYLAEVETRAGPMQSRIGLAQPFPWPGKLEAAATAAEHLAQAAGSEVDARRLEVAHEVQDAWFELSWLKRAIGITARHRSLLLGWEQVARSHFESGSGSHADVIRAQVELGKLENRVQTLADLERPIAARLNATLGRPTATTLPAPDETLARTPDLDGAALQEQLSETSPALLSQRHRIEAAEQAVILAEKEFWPDFSLGADYTFIGDASNPGVSGSGDDAFALSLGIELPIWRSAYRAGEREAQARLSGARRMLEAATLELEADLEMALYRLRDANRRVDLFRNTLIPKGEESVASSDAGYRTGHQDFLDLLDAQRVLLEFQLQTVRAETDSAQALAEIERLTGTRTRGVQRP